LVADEELIWGDWSAADLVRRIYRWLGVERRSCRWIANELNLLGVPTSYQRDTRGVRGKTTQGIWRPGRIRNLVVNPVYYGLLLYGRRKSQNSKRTGLINASVPALVTEELWQAAQRTLADNRLNPKNTRRTYLLRGVLKCALCNLAFCGGQNRPGVWWYRCNGHLPERGGKEHRCKAKSIRSTDIEPVVWADIEALLRNPYRFLDALQAEVQSAPDKTAAEAEALLSTLETAIADLEPRRQRTLDLFERGRITSQELDERLDQIDQERKQLEERRNVIVVPERPEAAFDVDLLALIRERLDEGLSDEQRSEIVRLLVKQITVHTSFNAKGGKDLRLVIEYRFSPDWCRPTRNGTDSLRRRASSWPGT
jgi:site-specific DNA recombinase